MSIELSPRRVERRLVGAVLVASTAAVLGAGVATGALLRAPAEVDACASPAGVTVDGRHVLLCEDLTGAQYRAAIGVEPSRCWRR